MSEQAWAMPTDPESAARRAGGRRHYNTVRKVRAMDRLRKVVDRLRVKGSLTRWGFQADLARQLKVSRSTISRDMKRLMALGDPCPHCGALAIPPKPEEAGWDVDDEDQPDSDAEDASQDG